jgi:uncharacterized protein (DUF2336 family)
VSFPTRTQLPFLASLEGRNDPEARRVLLRIATDRFVNDPAPSREATARYEQEALPLIFDCDPATRLIVARKIAPQPAAPVAMLELILDRGGAAALVVLERAAAIRRVLLVAAVGDDPAKACAVARRGDLDEDMIGLLALQPAHEVAYALADNPSAPIPTEILMALARRAEGDEKLARALLARGSAPLELAALFLYASSTQRATMLIAAQRAELVRSSPSSPWPRSAGAAAKLERHALARQPALFVATLAAALGCTADLAERIVAEPTGESLAVALAALGAPEDATMRILLLGDAVTLDYKRLGALTRLKDALHPAAARRIVAAMVGSQRVERALVDPVLDPAAAAAPSRAAPPREGSAKPDAAQVLRRRRALALSVGGRMTREG